jgi:hypothetical protein
MSSIASQFLIGPRIAGSILGASYQHYRPTAATNPIASGFLLGTTPVWVTADEDGRGRKAQNYGKPVWFGMFDPTVVSAGDYLVGTLGTFFVASVNPPMPLQMVLCNRVLTITNPAPMSGTGPLSVYGGDQSSTETLVATTWPGSLLQGTKAHGGDTRLPGDADQAWSSVLLPAIPGTTLRNDMIITDDLSQRHVVSSAEQTPLGWRLTTLLAST